MSPVDLPAQSLQYGFANTPIGTHGSRTMMLPELRSLLSSLPATAGLEDYRSAVVEENLLVRGTLAGRKGVFRALRELYGLNPSVLLFRSLRDLWDADAADQPLLVLLCAAARDPLLRASADTVLLSDSGDRVTPQQLAGAVAEAFPGRYSQVFLDHLGRNLASSWSQSGHLAGRQPKKRATAASGPTGTAYALLLGHLCGERGEGLLGSLWARILDVPVHLLRQRAAAASQMGWVDYRHAGGVTDVGFAHLLRGTRVEA